MGHSAQFQAEVVVGNLEIQAERMLEQASILRGAGQLEIANQVMAQHERLLAAITALRNALIRGQAMH
ncbi:hypothetical protein PS918_03101 [Pseudomonas fluorescens]|uniref:Uncharacterized protein n=1 Tax=Pseudomonas fluorescens TaxID=294 RepID=A0A5E7ST68_PSEFL|nr:hypothetical protein [Pseudomonas fluorescens]VVP89596.1 hypothetical protein PS918_03101 [Pseudomonas fluorescens]